MTRSQYKLSIFEAQRIVPRTKTMPGTMWRPWWQRDRRGHKKLRFREKLETKKCRDTQYRHIIVTIVTLPVGLSACDLLLLIGQLSAFSPSDWLMVSWCHAPRPWCSWHSWQYSKSYLTLSQLTKCHGNPEFYAEGWGLCAWHFLSSSERDTRRHLRDRPSHD